MVSLWPFGARDDTTANFEKTLSALSAKIKTAKTTRDSFRARSRKYKVVWTLYTSLAYLLSALILVFITGWQNWGPVEYSVISGGPVLIYVVRTALSTYYEYRLSSSQTHLDDLDKQRDDAIKKFKAATKYDSTQKLLEKYGAAPKPPATPKEPAQRKPENGLNRSMPQRTGLPPPLTANIPRRASEAFPAPNPQQQHLPMSQSVSSHSSSPLRAQTAYSSFNEASLPSSPRASASFAPNAFSTIDSVPQYAQPKWYDRVMDLLIGEDETRASNRLALICQHCKLVNGQAPPGVKRLEDVGRWRCAECKGWNGIENEIVKLLDEVRSSSSEDFGEPGPAVVNGVEEPKQSLNDENLGEGEEPEAGADGVETEVEDVTEDPEVEESTPARSTRSRSKGTPKT